MRKGLLWVKKVVVMLICMVMVTDSQAVGAIAAKTADTLMADDKELEAERDTEENLIVEDIIETEKQRYQCCQGKREASWETEGCNA